MGVARGNSISTYGKSSNMTPLANITKRDKLSTSHNRGKWDEEK